MNATDEKWDNLVDSLRRAKPVLDDPDALTDRIMQQIDRSAAPSTINLRNSYPEGPETTFPRPVHLTLHIMNWIRLVSCSAAVLLLGLFLFQQWNVQGVAAGTSRWSAAGYVQPSGQSQAGPFEGQSIVDQSYTSRSVDGQPLDSRLYAGQPFEGQSARVREAYLCYLKQHAIQNAKFRSYYQRSID